MTISLSVFTSITETFALVDILTSTYKAEQSYRAAIPYHNRKISMSNASTEAQIAKEEAQIAQLNCQIRRGSVGGVHHNGHHHNHHSVVVKNNDKKDKNKIKTEQVRPSIIRPSPFSHHLNVSNKRNVSFHVSVCSTVCVT